MPLRLSCFVPLFFLLLTGVGCDVWPLYAHLPDPGTERRTVETVAVKEQPASMDQSLGSLGEARRFVISGRADSCGFDSAGTGPSFPQHPIDDDGDGVAESSRARVGWYSGDVDLFVVDALVGLRITAELRWTEAPAVGTNAPYRPEESDGAWSQESDLDLWMLLSPRADELGSLVGDDGVSRRHPEEASAGIVVPPGESAGIGVACHHGLPSSYELTVLAQTLGQY